MKCTDIYVRYLSVINTMETYVAPLYDNYIGVSRQV